MFNTSKPNDLCSAQLLAWNSFRFVFINIANVVIESQVIAIATNPHCRLQFRIQDKHRAFFNVANNYVAAFGHSPLSVGAQKRNLGWFGCGPVTGLERNGRCCLDFILDVTKRERRGLPGRKPNHEYHDGYENSGCF